MSDFDPRYEPWFFKSDPGELCPFGCRCQEAAAKIESDAKVIAEKDAEIRSMIAVHNSDVDGMRLQEEKIADQKRVIAALREALDEQIDAHLATWMAARAEVEGAATARTLFDQEPDVIAARNILKSTDEQTVGENK